MLWRTLLWNSWWKSSQKFLSRQDTLWKTTWTFLKDVREKRSVLFTSVNDKIIFYYQYLIADFAELSRAVPITLRYLDGLLQLVKTWPMTEASPFSYFTDILDIWMFWYCEIYFRGEDLWQSPRVRNISPSVNQNVRSFWQSDSPSLAST